MVEPVDVASVMVRAAAFVAALQAAGLVMFGSTGGPASPRPGSATQRLGITALLAMGLVVGQRLLDGGRMAGDWSGVLDGGLQRMLWSRRPGLSSAACAAGLLAVAAGAPLRGRWRMIMSWLGISGVIGSFALTGHTTESHHAGVLGALLVAHVALVAFWLGGVRGLHAMSARVAAADLALAAERFSRAAVWLVPLILPAGLLMIWGLVPDLRSLATPYGACLLAKLTGFCALMLLAGANRLRLVPALSKGSPAAVRTFRRVLTLEYAILAGVLAVTATMTALFSWA